MMVFQLPTSQSIQAETTSDAEIIKQPVVAEPGVHRILKDRLTDSYYSKMMKRNELSAREI